MSGISGILSTSAHPIDRTQQEMLIDGVGRRGPDGIEVFSAEGVLLAHGHLGIPRFAVTNLSKSDETLKIVGDLRLDDRATLLDKLQIDGLQLDTPDVELLSHAYTKWGTDLCAHIIGEFAFAIWDEEKRQLFCARDHMGIRPLYYRHTEDDFSFSSDLRALGADLKESLDDEKIAAFLAGLIDISEETQHPGIFRLLPAQCLTWSEGRITTRTYWELECKTYQGSDATGDFRLLFERAIQDRMREGSDVGAMLSGGLDSSSIACVASRHLQDTTGEPLKAYSLVFENTPTLDESAYVDAVLDVGNFDAKRKACDNVPALATLIQTIDEQSGFPQGPNSAVSEQIFELAKSDGCKILLDGHGGDEVVWHGAFYISELARKGKWFEAFALVDTVCQIYDESRIVTYLGAVREYSKSRLVRKVAGALQRRWKRRLEGEAARPAWQQAFNPEFVKKANLTKLQKTFHAKKKKKTPTRDQDHQFAALSAPLITLAFEELDNVSASRGIESRYPFYDVRLVDFCLSLPASEKLRKNESRSIVKRALKGILPESVRTRQTKINFISAITNGILNHHMDLLDEIESGAAAPLYAYLDETQIAKLSKTLKAKRDKINGLDIAFIWRALVLYMWLKSLNETKTAEKQS